MEEKRNKSNYVVCIIYTFVFLKDLTGGTIWTLILVFHVGYRIFILFLTYDKYIIPVDQRENMDYVFWSISNRIFKLISVHFFISLRW